MFVTLSVCLLRNRVGWLSAYAGHGYARQAARSGFGKWIARYGRSPVISEIADDRTGSYGRVNIIMPRPSRLRVRVANLRTYSVFVTQAVPS